MDNCRECATDALGLVVVIVVFVVVVVLFVVIKTFPFTLPIVNLAGVVFSPRLNLYRKLEGSRLWWRPWFLFSFHTCNNIALCENWIKARDDNLFGKDKGQSSWYTSRFS